MAVVYFTSNASTGAGSLVEAVKNARPGDVIRPDETVFERGSTIEIALASTLTVAKNLTLDAALCRVRLVVGGATGLTSARGGVVVEVSGFDFVGGVNSSTYYHGGGATISENSTAVFNRCLFAGCETSRSGGAIFVQAGSNAEVRDSLIVGCRAASTSGGLCASGVASVSGSTVVGNVDSTGVNDAGGSGKASFFNSIIGASSVRTSNENVGSVVDVASSSVGFVASPPDDLTPEDWNANLWQDWDLRLFDDASLNPSPYRDSGDVDAASKYDLDGNFRGRETNGVATRSPGAYETLQADLFWVGEPFPQTLVDLAPQNLVVSDFVETSETRATALVAWTIPENASYSKIHWEYKAHDTTSFTPVYPLGGTAKKRTANVYIGYRYVIRICGEFADGRRTAWSYVEFDTDASINDATGGGQLTGTMLPSALSVVNPSFQTSVGWATSRFATVSGDVAPQVEQKLFVDGAVVFNDVLTTANANGQRFALTLGGGANVRFPSGAVHLFDLQTGAASTFTFSSVRPSEARFGDWSRLAGTFSALPKYDVGSQVYIQAAQFYSFAQPEATYGVLTVYAQKSPALQLDGAYRCDEFRIYAGAAVSDVCAITAPGTTVRARVVNWGSASSTVAERLVSEPITLILQEAASLVLPDEAPESWVDGFVVDVSETTSATLKLNGQTVYGDAPTCAVALTGSATIAERGLDVASLTLAADATLNVDVGIVRAGALTVADGANVAFSSANAGTAGVSVDAVLTASESATVGNATFTGNGYFATPSETDLTAATFAEIVRVVDYSAGVANFTVTATGPKTATLDWSATDATARVCVERENAASPNGWETLAITPTEDASPLEVALSGRERFRIFDGQTFTVDSAWFSVEFYQCRTVSVAVASTSGGAGVVWETNEGGIMFVDGKEPKVGENCCVYAKIKSPLSGTWVPAERVASVEATVWRTGSVVETTLGAVAYRPIPARTVVPGWNGVSLSPSLVLEAPILPVEPPVADETEGYNFIWTPDVGENPIFPESGTYRIQVVFTLDDGTQIYLTEDATVKNR